MCGEVTRLISARKANQREKRKYDETRYKLDPKKPRKLTTEERRRLEKTPIDHSDIPPLGDEFFAKVAEDRIPAKQQLTIRLDADVLKWLKANGRGYQTRINRILRAAMTYQGTHDAEPEQN